MEHYYVALPNNVENSISSQAQSLSKRVIESGIRLFFYSLRVFFIINNMCLLLARRMYTLARTHFTHAKLNYVQFGTGPDADVLRLKALSVCFSLIEILKAFQLWS